MASDSSSEFRIFSAEQLLAEIQKDAERTKQATRGLPSQSPGQQRDASLIGSPRMAMYMPSPIPMKIEANAPEESASAADWNSFLNEHSKPDPRLQVVPRAAPKNVEKVSTKTDPISNASSQQAEASFQNSIRTEDETDTTEGSGILKRTGPRAVKRRRRVTFDESQQSEMLWSTQDESQKSVGDIHESSISLDASSAASQDDTSPHQPNGLQADGDEEDEGAADRLWNEECPIVEEIWNSSQPTSSRSRGSSSSSAGVGIRNRTATVPDKPIGQATTTAKIQRGKRLFAVADKAVANGHARADDDEEKARRKTLAVQKAKERALLEDDDDTFDIRPNFADDNVAAGRDGEGHVPLVLDTNRIHQVHAWANRYLRQYQRDGIQFMYKNVSKGMGVVLNDDMGLGKTVQVVSLCLALLEKHGTSHDKRRVKERKRARELSSAGDRRPEGPDHGTILIIAPKSVMNQWGRELNTWGYFDWEDLGDAEGDSAKLDLLAKCHAMSSRSVVCNPEILLMPYSILARSLTKDKEKAVVLHALFKIRFRLVVFDEVHTLKNLKSNQTTNARKISATARIGLTGTMMQNNLKEFWTVLTTIHPKALANWKSFNEFYAKPIKMARTKTASQEVLRIGQARAQRIRAILDRYLLRRTKKLIEDQLPKKKENVVFCKLTDLQKRVYDRIANGKDATLLKFAKEPCTCGRNMLRGKCCYKGDETAPLWNFFHPDGDLCKRCPWCLQLPMISKLINCCNHIDLLKFDPTADSPSEIQGKMAFAKEAFGEDVEEIGGFARATQFEMVSNHEFSGKLLVLGQLLNVWKLQPTSRVLVFSHYTRILDIIGKYLDRNGMTHCRIDGSTSMQQRVAVVDSFNNLNDRNNFVFLISTKAGGLGLNLTAANIVVLFDSSWNPSFDVQAQDRAYRLGQRRDVDVYRLISTGTIEDKTYCRQLYKLQLSSEALEGNSEERFFEGVQDDPRRQGELFGVHNLMDYNPLGHMAELKKQYKWQSSVPAVRMSAATKAAIQAGNRSGFVVETVGDVKPSAEEVEAFEEEEDELDMMGSRKQKAKSDLDDMEMAQLWAQAFGLPLDDPDGKQLEEPSLGSDGGGQAGKRKKKAKQTSLVDNLTKIVESGHSEFTEDDYADELLTEDEDEGDGAAAEDQEEEPGVETDDEDETKLQVGQIIQNHSHMALNASDLVKGMQGRGEKNNKAVPSEEEEKVPV